jgi:superfamily II DNA or RNA helicase
MYIHSHYRSTKKILREKQMSVFQKVQEFFKEGKTSGYIKLPTGTGKTVLFGQIIRAVANGNSKALIVVPRIQLVQQTYESLKKFAPELSIGRINMHQKEYGNKITILTYASWQIQIESGELSPNDYDYIILDEGHRALTPKIKPLVEDAKKGSIVLGFSATPGFSADKHLRELIEHEIYTMELSEAIYLGLLSGVRVMLVEVDVDLSNTASVRGDYDTKDLEKLINTEKVNHAALQVYMSHFRGKCAMVYANSIQHVSDLVTTFANKGVEARGIHGSLPKKTQEKILTDFHNKKFDVLVNCDLLIEGFDEPRTTVCLNLRPTQSVVLAEQRGGRVLRLDPENKNKIAYVVDFIYKESTKRKQAILFSQITGGALVLPESFSTSLNLESGEVRFARELIEIDGAKVIYDIKQIDEITQKTIEHNKQLGLSKLTFEELKEEVKLLGLRSSSQYRDALPKHPRWPADIRFYEGKGWNDLFDFKFLSLIELKKQLEKLGIKKQKDYNKQRPKHNDWPSMPIQYYSELSCWGDLWGIEKVTYLTLPELKIAVKRAKVDNVAKYREARKTRPAWPAVPDRDYKGEGGWISWPDLFGKVAGGYIETLEELKKQVRAAGINAISAYYENRRPQWPSMPKDFYNDWIDWPDLFGKEKIDYIESFEKLKTEVAKAKVTSAKGYQLARKNHPNWPSQPEKIFEQDWDGWVSFLGKTSARSNEFLPWSDFVKAVRLKGIKTSTEYINLRSSLPKGWPSDPSRFYNEWVSWRDTLDE